MSPSGVLFFSSFHGSSWFIKSMTCLHFHALILFQILVSKMVPYKSITLNHSLSNLIISSQRLVTMSVSLCTQTRQPILFCSNPKDKSQLLNVSVTSVHSNLEYGLAILTGSFSPLRSVLHNLSCWSPKQKCTLSYVIPFYIMYTQTRLIWFSLASAGSNQPELRV